MLKSITMDGTGLRLNLNLKNLSMVSIATMLWDSEGIRNRMKNNFSGLDGEQPGENWCEMSKLVVEYARSLNLPPSLSVVLNKTISLVGQKIYDWIFYVTQILGLDLICTQKIYFSFGVIDEIKIFDLYWINLMAHDNFINESHHFKHSPLFSLACIYGRENFVKERKKEMLDELSQFYPQMKMGDEIYNIMSVSICMTKRNKIPGNVTLPLKMFKVCLKAGLSKAARFYWEKLDEIEKVSNLPNFARRCMRKYFGVNYLRDNNCENLLFLINEMGEEERYSFLTNYANEIIILFLHVWPYQELIADLLKYDWNIESAGLWKMASYLICFGASRTSSEYPEDNQLVFQIMKKAWGKISADEKILFFTDDSSQISTLFSTLNPEMLNLFLNDPSMREVDGEKVDYFIMQGFLELVKMGKFDFLHELIETVFNFIPEPKELLKEHFYDHNFVRNLIGNDESFGLIEQFLDWSTESEAQRARLKNKINTISVCRYLTEPKYKCLKFERADIFLKWRLETDAEIKRFKEEMRSSNFAIVGSGEYVRIKSGDLSWLSPGDSFAIHPNEDPYDNADGLTFLKFQDATELNRGVVLGIKSFCPNEDYYFLGPGCCHASISDVDYVGTEAGDFILFIVREIWYNRQYCCFCLDDVVRSSNSFIKFYYETDEEVLKFKKTKLHGLVTENPKKFLLEALEGQGSIPLHFLDYFCIFCMIPLEKIEEIKIQERNDIEEILDTYLIDQLNFEFADKYLNFLFGEVKKTDAAKKFLNSSNKAALLCVSYIKKHGEVSPFGDYGDMKICIWLNMVDDIEKLKNDVVALNENTPGWFPALLDRLANLDLNTFWLSK